MSCIVDWAISQVVGKHVILAVVWTMAGALVRTMQSIILWRRINHTRWWEAASILGLTMSWAIGWAVGWVLGWAIGSAVRGNIGETPVGIEEWFVLRNQIYEDDWWMLASIIGWSVGLALVEIIEWLTLRQLRCVSSRKVGANLGVRPWGRHPGLPLTRIIEKIPRCCTVRWMSVMVMVGVWGMSVSLGIELGSLVGLLIDSTIIVVVVGLLIGWTIVGAMAGSLLLWLWRRPVSAI